MVRDGPDLARAGVGVELHVNARLEDQHDVGAAELEVGELLALDHVLAFRRGQDDRGDLRHADGDDRDHPVSLRQTGWCRGSRPRASGRTRTRWSSYR